jgi:hypothetical protein
MEGIWGGKSPIAQLLIPTLPNALIAAFHPYKTFLIAQGSSTKAGKGKAKVCRL